MCPAPEIPPDTLNTESLTNIAVALVGATALLIGYLIQQSFARRERRTALYGEAVRAIEDYLEAPFLIARRDSAGRNRQELTTQISAIQSRIVYYRTQLEVHAPRAVANSYVDLIKISRQESGRAMSDAWKAKPIKHDRDISLVKHYGRKETDIALDNVVKHMRKDAGPRLWRR